MGVTGLWKLIEPCGKPVPVETLEGKVLAVDISIWLHQVVKGFQDNKGAALNNAHLLGLFNRLCKLMYYRVKPVFVFDGCVPQLKKDTIARRQQQRSKLNSEAERIQNLLLQSLAKEKIVQQALGSNAEHLLTSPVKKIAARKEDTVDDMFKLPEMPSSSKKNTEAESNDESFDENSFYSDQYTTTSASADDSSFDEINPRHAYNTNIQAIDVRSKEFLQLPADVRHEILVDIKETRKQSSWGRLHELPSRSVDFSSFQMKRLLKRRDVQVSLESAEKEMGGRTLTYAELTNIFSEEGILETDIVEKGTKQITSDEHTRFLLVKDLKQKLAKAKEEPIKAEKKVNEDEKPKPSKQIDCPTLLKNDGKKLGNEYNADLELAIALSLEDDVNRVYDEKDYDYESDESLKLSKPQIRQLQNTAKGPALSYMIEYAGMNKEEVAGILENTQNMDDTLDIDRLVGNIHEKTTQVEETIKPKANEQINSESQEIRLCVSDDSDETDSDLEEVQDSNNETNKELNQLTVRKLKDKDIEAVDKSKNLNEITPDNDRINDSDETDSDLEEVENVGNFDLEEECIIEETPPCLSDELETKPNSSKILNIQIDLVKPLCPKDDLFADIFENIQLNEITAKDSAYFGEIKTNKDRRSSCESKHNETKIMLEEENKPKTQIKTSSKILTILDELKQQAEDVKNIKLENIKLSDSVIEISDDEAKVNFEVIEVCDSDNNEKRCSTPPPTEMQSPKFKSKSPNFRTPSKNHSITEFFHVDYVVKRTPDKSLQEDNKEVPKVKSPFFVNKTPKSGLKTGSNSPLSSKTPSKAIKILFDEENASRPKENIEILDNDFIPLNELKPTVNEKDILNEAANILKAQKTAVELNTIASDLVKERQKLENERNRQDRMGMSITQRMNTDCQDLLRLFGIPFIVAPMEAEAQCAFLDIVQLTNGTITDDSDIWLFGGQTVYKNFFAQNKHVMEFRSEQIEKDFNCDRKRLIQLACLVGSDYTTGIHGIGAVTALEILASFTPKDIANKSSLSSEPVNVSAQTILNTLQKFRNWWHSFKSTVAPPGTSARLALQKKLKNIELNEGFPSVAVVEAYLTPKVDENKETFSWGYPDVESLKEFTRKNFGWTTSKTEDILMPVLNKLNEKRTQQTIRNYFKVKNALTLKQIRVSKRVQNAIEKMSGNLDSDDSAENPTRAKRARKYNTAVQRRKQNTFVNEPDFSTKQLDEVCLSVEEATCSNQMARGPIKRVNKRINLPETKQIIPQREKDLAQMAANKKLAAEIMKKSNKETKKKKKIVKHKKVE